MKKSRGKYSKAWSHSSSSSIQRIPSSASVFTIEESYNDFQLRLDDCSTDKNSVSSECSCWTSSCDFIIAGWMSSFEWQAGVTRLAVRNSCGKYLSAKSEKLHCLSCSSSRPSALSASDTASRAMVKRLCRLWYSSKKGRCFFGSAWLVESSKTRLFSFAIFDSALWTLHACWPDYFLRAIGSVALLASAYLKKCSDSRLNLAGLALPHVRAMGCLWLRCPLNLSFRGSSGRCARLGFCFR